MRPFTSQKTEVLVLLMTGGEYGMQIQYLVGNSFEAGIGTDGLLTLPVTAISQKHEYRAHGHRQQSPQMRNRKFESCFKAAACQAE
jgi:hypothetical protein